MACVWRRDDEWGKGRALECCYGYIASSFFVFYES